MTEQQPAAPTPEATATTIVHDDRTDAQVVADLTAYLIEKGWPPAAAAHDAANALLARAGR